MPCLSTFTDRRALLAAAGALVLSACGGGGGAVPPPSSPLPPGPIVSFVADKPSYFVGERATLTAVFSGTGRIEPGIGPVTSGAAVQTAVLDATTSFRLIVDAASGPVSRELALPVEFRNRYETPAQSFSASQFAAVTTGDGSVLVLGGSRSIGIPSDAIDRFDPATRAFTRIGSMRTGRLNHTATRLPDGRILVAGGAQGVVIGNVADVIDERTGAVSGGGTLTTPRFGHADALLADGRVMLAGGFDRASVELWDPNMNLWRAPAAAMAHSREGATATLLADGRVLIAGGAPSVAVPNYMLAEVFDPRSETFTPVAAPGIAQRSQHAAHRLSDGSVLLLGGELVDGTPTKSVLRFDPATMRITPVAELTVARTLARSVVTPDDCVLLFGGQVDAAGHTATAESYRLGAGGTPIAALTGARAFHAAHRLRDGRILIVGGENSDGTFAAQVQIFE